MQFALLGDVQFELITYFDGLDGKFGVDYAEHARIEGKPRLQRVGDKLDEWSLKLKFHQTYCDPEAELIKLKDAMRTYTPASFVLATGSYKGDFVITDMSLNSEQTTKEGALISATVDVTLREAVGLPGVKARPNAPAIAKSGTPYHHPTAKNNVTDQARPNIPSASVRDAALSGRNMFNAASSISNVMTLAMTLKNNPSAAVEQLRYGVTGFSLLAQAADLFGLQLGSLRSLVGDAGPMLAMAGNISGNARSAATMLNGSTTSNYISSMALANSSLGLIGSDIDASTPMLARLSAKTITREVV